eukprot:358192-Chlamydomonas_euryale.AAC.13
MAYTWLSHDAYLAASFERFRPPLHMHVPRLSAECHLPCRARELLGREQDPPGNNASCNIHPLEACPTISLCKSLKHVDVCAWFLCVAMMQHVWHEACQLLPWRTSEGVYAAASSHQTGKTGMHGRTRVRVTGSGPMKSMPVLSVARHRGSSSGQGAVTRPPPVTKDTPLRTVLSPPYQPHPASRDVRTGRLRAAEALSRHAERGLPTTCTAHLYNCCCTQYMSVLCWTGLPWLILSA